MEKEELLDSLKSKKFPDFIIKAFDKVKREDFIPSPFKEFAYDDNALPIGQEQTISQPYTIAFMLNLLDLKPLLNKSSRILEIGSGSGYVLALLAEILKNSDIYGLEINSLLAKASSNRLLEYKNIKILNKSGTNGLPEEAQFDRILVSASAENLLSLSQLLSQLSDSGILTAPVQHTIYQIQKKGKDTIKKEFYGFSFVPLIEK